MPAFLRGAQPRFFDFFFAVYRKLRNVTREASRSGPCAELSSPKKGKKGEKKNYQLSLLLVTVKLRSYHHLENILWRKFRLRQKTCKSDFTVAVSMATR